jgi:uncharacterized membrane protein YkoI
LKPIRLGTRAKEFSDSVSAGDIVALGSAKVSLDQAIADAERDMRGRVVEAVFKATPGRPHYVVWMTKNGDC